MASITERKDKNGNVVSYRIRVRRGRDVKPFEMTWTPPEGMTNKRTISANLKKVAAEFEVKCKQGAIATEKKTFGNYAEYVLTLKANNGLIKPRTAERYKELLERINDVDCNGIGYMKLSDIRAEHLNRFYITLSGEGMNKKTGEGLSAKTIREHHRFISTVFAQATKEGLVPFNVAEKATPPKVQKKEIESYSPELIGKILQALETEDIKWQACLHLLISSGCRLGECLGLHWNNVDFTNNRIFICNNLQYLPELGLYETSTKTEHNHFVSLPTSTMNVLRAWKKEQGKRYKISRINGFVFTQADGVSPMHKDSVGDFLNRFSERNGFPHLHPHGFRHSAASILINAGEDIATVSKRLGHQQISTTLNIYTHAIEKADKDAADKMEAIMYGNAGREKSRDVMLNKKGCKQLPRRPYNKHSEL